MESAFRLEMLIGSLPCTYVAISAFACVVALTDNWGLTVGFNHGDSRVSAGRS